MINFPVAGGTSGHLLGGALAAITLGPWAGMLVMTAVIAVQPSILVLDEPSAGLDPRARRTLINLLRDLLITMLVSTHDMKLVEELFPRTIAMDEGLIVADEKLLNEHGLEKP